MRSWTDDQLKEAVKVSDSLCEAIRRLGLRPVGGNYKSIKKHIQNMCIDISHFQRLAMLGPLKNRNSRSKIPDDLIFRKNGVWMGTRLRKRVLSDGRIQYECEICLNQGIHEGKPLTLQLDHKNGDHRDCQWENLRWLCPNCHTQTPTYSRTSTRPSPTVPDSSQLSLGVDCVRGGSRPSKRKKPHDEVKRVFEELGSYRKTSQVLGISDVAVKKIVTGSGWKKA